MTAIWEKQEDETSLQFAAFKKYLELPPTERSIRKSSMLRGAKSHSHDEKWSVERNWVKRAEAYDAFIDRQTTNLVVTHMADARAQHIRNMTGSLAVAHELGMGILLSMKEQFSRPANPNNPDDGKVDTTALKRVVATLEDIDTLMRRTLGMPTQYKIETVPDTEIDDNVYVVGRANDAEDDD